MITFKSTGGDDVVHMELDGEYFALEKPHSIYIQQSEDFVNGKINLVALKKKEVRLQSMVLETKPIDFEKTMRAKALNASSTKSRRGN